MFKEKTLQNKVDIGKVWGTFKIKPFFISGKHEPEIFKLTAIKPFKYLFNVHGHIML